MVKRIIIGESGGPTPVIDWEVAGALAAAQRRGWQVYGMMNGLQGLLYANAPGNVVDLTHIDPMSFCFNGPGAGLGTTRMDPEESQLTAIAKHLKLLEIDAVVYIGGNDSANMLGKLAAHSDVQAVHAIKTIDNDLPATHHCPGFGSAALYNATSIKNVCCDMRSYRALTNFDIDGAVVQRWTNIPVLVYQAMGRKAGWLTHAAAFAKVDPKGELDPDRPPHVFLSWETPFEEEPFLQAVQQAIDRHGLAVVVTGEDIRVSGKEEESLATLEKKRLKQEVRYDPSGNLVHGAPTSFSPAIYLAQFISDKLKVAAAPGGLKEVAMVPQHIQRSCMMSPVDASEAYLVGWAAVEGVAEGQTGKSVVLQRGNMQTTTSLADVATIANKVRLVEPPYIRGYAGPTQEFVDEFIYLIGGPAAIPHYSATRLPHVTVPAEIEATPYVCRVEGKK